MMLKVSSSTPSSMAPCTLKAYHPNSQIEEKEFTSEDFSPVGTQSPCLCHSPSEVESSFQQWAANSAAGYPEDSGLCDKMKDHLSAVNQLGDCPCAIDALYWCPYCSRPERVKRYEDLGDVAARRAIRRKCAMLRLATAFFKYFGSRTPSKGRNSGMKFPISTTIEAVLQEMDGADPKEADPKELLGSGKMELPGSEPANWELDNFHNFDLKPATAQFPPIHNHSFHESPEAYFANFDSAFPHTNCLHELSASNAIVANPVELLGHPIDRRSVPNLDKPLPPPPYSSVILSEPGATYTTSSQFDVSADYSASISGTDAYETYAEVTSPSQAHDIRTRPLDHGEPIVATFASLRPSQRLSQERENTSDSFPLFKRDMVDFHLGIERDSLTPLLRKTITVNTSWSARDGAFYFNGSLESTQTHMQDIYNLILTVNHEWRQRLASRYNTLPRCFALSIPNLFRKGFNAVQECFRGRLPTTLEDIFALIHLGCTFAFMLHRDDELFCWDQFFEELLLWRLALSKKDDKCLLQQLINSLAYPEGQSINTDDEDIAYNYVAYNGLLVMLQRGQILKDCSLFLDGVEYAGISSRITDSSPPPWPCSLQNTNGAQRLIDMITKRLQQHPGMHDFHLYVAEVECHLRNEMLLNPRELEVMLNTNTKSHSSSRMFQRYQALVRTLCDEAMEQQDPTWRYPYHVTVLDNVTAIYEEIENLLEREDSVAKQLRDVSVLTVIRATTPGSAAATSPTSAGCQRTPTSSTTATGSASSSQTDHRDTPLTSPSTVGADTPLSFTWQTSPSSASTPSIITEDQMIRCPLCPMKFKPQSGRTNLKRHLASAKAHNFGGSIICPEPGCNAKLGGRHDNFNKHFQKKHYTSPEDQNSRKRRKETEM